MGRVYILLFACLVSTVFTVPVFASGNAIVPDSSFGNPTFTQLPPSDDGSSGFVPFGFNINFYGTDYSGVYINTNGNVTFTGPLATFTPYGLGSTGTPIIAPLFADVDTVAGSRVEYNTTTYNGRNVFVVNWPGVRFYPAANASVLDYFQLLIVDRPDLGTSPNGDNFDVYFNYNSIQWDDGTASGGNANGTNAPPGNSAYVGFSNGTPDGSFQMPGSGISGSFLDTNTTTGLIYSTNDGTPGSYLFEFQNGEVPQPVPTPSALLLLGPGLVGLMVVRRRFKKA
jgi:hypothetical protein